MSGIQRRSSRKDNPPFPTRQMTILALCRICEPIAFMSIFPYVYYMTKDFGIAKNDSEIAAYAGMLLSAFAFAEFSSGVAWGRLSDRIGRKPVLLTGLAGTALSMLIFGFAPSFPAALLARALGGLLNGNIGVLQTIVAETVTAKEHQPRAYTIMPFVWCLGSIVGSILGGALARPVLEYPYLFAERTIWERFPYLLPNLLCTVIASFGVAIGILFLEETHAEKRLRDDPGLAAGKWILNKFTLCANLKASRSETIAGLDEALPLLGDEQPPGYRTPKGSPDLHSTPLPKPQKALDLNAWHITPKSKPTATKVFGKLVVLNIVGYSILAYHTMTFDAMLPTLLSTPAPKSPEWNLPFKFISGYGLNPKEIGVVMLIQASYSMFATMVALGLFRLIALSYPVLYFSTPYFVLLPRPIRLIGVYALIFWKCTFATLAYPSNAILLTDSAPSPLVLGVINGVAASAASLSRALAPTASGLLFSAGLGLGYSGLTWWCSAVIAVGGAIVSLSLSDKEVEWTSMRRAT
ncbi:MFS multidrug transporter-like protein [Cadophora sp. DSE1049]|nr:MFS multidrug transporter-like protein [Cadophora sp. DSE1049]